MTRQLLFVLLISFGVLQFSSCTQDDEHKDGTSQKVNESDAKADTAGSRDHSGATESPPIPYTEIPDNQPVIHRVRAGHPGADGWCLAKPTRGNFSVMLPGQFVDSMVKSTTTTGRTGAMHTVATITAEGIEFNALQTEIVGKHRGGSPAESMIDRFEELGATVTQRELVVANQPAVRLHVEAEGVTAEFVLFSWSNNEYLLAVQSRLPGPGDENLQADIERFFDSFKILNPEE